MSEILYRGSLAFIGCLLLSLGKTGFAQAQVIDRSKDLERAEAYLQAFKNQNDNAEVRLSRIRKMTGKRPAGLTQPLGYYTANIITNAQGLARRKSVAEGSELKKQMAATEKLVGEIHNHRPAMSGTLPERARSIVLDEALSGDKDRFENFCNVWPSDTSEFYNSVCKF